jgi:hypothetical protein
MSMIKIVFYCDPSLGIVIKNLLIFAGGKVDSGSKKK